MNRYQLLTVRGDKKNKAKHSTPPEGGIIHPSNCKHPKYILVLRIQTRYIKLRRTATAAPVRVCTRTLIYEVNTNRSKVQSLDLCMWKIVHLSNRSYIQRCGDQGELAPLNTTLASSPGQTTATDAVVRHIPHEVTINREEVPPYVEIYSLSTSESLGRQSRGS